MDGHELHPVPRLRHVLIRIQCDMGQVVLQRSLFTAGCLILENRLLQFRQIVQPLLTALGPERLFIPALVQQGGKQLRNRRAGIVPVVPFHQIQKFPGLRSPEDRIFPVHGQSAEQGTFFLLRLLLQKADPFLSQISFRNIADPEEGKIIPVTDHPKVSQCILDFHPVEELHAAVNHIRDFLLPEDFLQHPGHIMGPVQHCDVPKRRPGTLQGADLFCNPLRFLLRSILMGAEDLRPRGIPGKKGFLNPVHIPADQ